MVWKPLATSLVAVHTMNEPLSQWRVLRKHVPPRQLQDHQTMKLLKFTKSIVTETEAQKKK